MLRTRAVLAITSCLSILVLGACSDDDPEPKIAPAPSRSEQSEPATSSASVRERQAAFIENYFRTISSALSSGDPNPFLRMSASTCVNCKTLARNIRAAYANGGHVEGSSWEVHDRKFRRKAPLGDIWTADVWTTQERWFTQNGDVAKVVNASVQHFGVALEPRDGEGWRVRELKVSS